MTMWRGAPQLHCLSANPSIKSRLSVAVAVANVCYITALVVNEQENIFEEKCQRYLSKTISHISLGRDAPFREVPCATT